MLTLSNIETDKHHEKDPCEYIRFIFDTVSGEPYLDITFLDGCQSDLTMQSVAIGFDDIKLLHACLGVIISNQSGK